jgi:excisionase family DNA binding protein
MGLSVEEAAQALGVSRRHFDRHIKPHLRVVSTGRRIVVPRRELERYLGHEAVIRVRHNEDAIEGAIETKSAAGRRTVPTGGLAAVLDEYDAYLHDRLGRSPRDDERYFPGEPRGRFCPKSLVERADEAWAEAGLDPVRLHDARHTYASLMIAAGVNAKALTTYMGHSTIQVTFDLYGHLLPGNEAEAAALLDAYLERAGVPKGVPTAPAAT